MNKLQQTLLRIKEERTRRPILWEKSICKRLDVVVPENEWLRMATWRVRAFEKWPFTSGSKVFPINVTDTIDRSDQFLFLNGAEMAPFKEQYIEHRKLLLDFLIHEAGKLDEWYVWG